MTQHSDWAPSSMSRILSCPASAEAVKLYEKEETDASNLGGVAHGILEDCLTFGIEPYHDDIGVVEGVQLAVDYANQRLLKPRTEMYVEKRLAIPDTPVWGTTDNVFVDPQEIEIVDFKNGYVPVSIKLNAQFMSYLLGAIAEFGERKHYKITVIQPRYDHIDGPIRSYVVSHKDIDWFQQELNWALNNKGKFVAGKHCKYCPVQGACKTFAAWIAPSAATAMFYDLTNIHAVKDETIAQLLDMADLLPGWIKELRKEGMRRIFADKDVDGYKVVDGKVERDWTADAEAKLPELYSEMGIPSEALYEAKFVHPATAEKHVKATFKGKGKWVEHWRKVEELITKKKGFPSLVRDIDGRPQFKRGMEFTELTDGEIEV